MATLARSRSTEEIAASYHTSTSGVSPFCAAPLIRIADMTGRVAAASIERVASARPNALAFSSSPKGTEMTAVATIAKTVALIASDRRLPSSAKESTIVGSGVIDLTIVLIERLMYTRDVLFAPTLTTKRQPSTTIQARNARHCSHESVFVDGTQRNVSDAPPRVAIWWHAV